MKKLLFLFLIASLFSCEENSCYLCEISTQTKIGNRDLWPTTTTLERCEVTQKEIKDYERANNTITPVNINGQIGITCLTCKCTKKNRSTLKLKRLDINLYHLKYKWLHYEKHIIY
jgi:hypothetical protein